MKKLFTCLIALALVFALPCSALAKDAIDYYTDMAKAMENVDSIAGRMNYSITLSVGEVASSMDMVINYHAVKGSNGNYDMAMTMAASSEGESVEIEAYFRDGWIYTKDPETGEKIKTKMDSFSPVASDMQITSGNIRSSKVDQVEGMTRITMTLDPTVMQDYLRFFLSTSLSASQLKGLKVDLVSYSALMDPSGVPSKERIRFVCSYTESGQTMKMDFDINHSMGRFNDISAISFPDLSGYTEL